jgi:hypothetical protein
VQIEFAVELQTATGIPFGDRSVMAAGWQPLENANRATADAPEVKKRSAGAASEEGAALKKRGK